MPIILALGPSTAGKSSLGKELLGLKSASKDEKWHVVSGDLVCDRIMTEDAPRRIKAALIAAGVFEKLLGYSSEKEVIRLAMNGVLTLSKGKFLITEHLFANPTLPDLEIVLRNAGFREDEIISFAGEIRNAAKIGNQINQRCLCEISSTACNDALELCSSDPKQTTVILDLAPAPTQSVMEVIQLFKDRLELFNKGRDNPIEGITASVCCDPLTLDTRVDRRNTEADEKKDPGDRRNGTFPFQHLAKFCAATDSEVKTEDSHASLGVLSRDALYNIVAKHCRRSSTDEKDVAVDITLNKEDKEGSVKLKLRVDSAEVIGEYGDLLKKFGIFDGREQTKLQVRSDFHFDIIINTAKGNARELAVMFLEELAKLRSEKSKTFSATAPTLVL